MCECVCMPSRCSLSRHQSAERKTWISHSSLQRKKTGVYASRAMLGDLLRKKHTERRRPFAQSRKILCQTFEYRPRCTVFLEGSAELRYFRILLMATMKKHDTNVDPREKGRKKKSKKRKRNEGIKEKRKGKRKKEMRVHVCATVSHRLVVAAAISRMHWYGSVKCFRNIHLV